VTEFARERRDQGVTWRELSEELGLRVDTLMRWCGATRSAVRALVPVRVVPEAAPRTLRVASPAGFHVDGLTLEETVALLRALG
jgi:hypothetical protein